jgi:hypothetical protein
VQDVRDALQAVAITAGLVAAITMAILAYASYKHPEFNIGLFAPEPSATPTRPPATATSASFPTRTAPTPTHFPIVLRNIDPPLSPAYVDSLRAMEAAFEVNGWTTGTSNPMGRWLEQRTYRTRLAYHLVTAPIGEFNGDTTLYWDWLLEQTRKVVESETDWESQRQYIYQQIYAVFTQPDCELAVRLRIIAAGNDPLIADAGPLVYWRFLFEPYYAVSVYTDFDRAARRFAAVAAEYRTGTYSGRYANVTFDEYLRQIDFLSQL